MTANVRIITPNDADAAVLTASPAAVSTLPVTNLQEPARALLWRSTSTATQTIKGDWADSYNVSGFALVRHNLTANATLRLKVYEGASQTGAVLYDSGAVAIGTMIGWGELVWGIDPWGGSNVFFNWAYAFTALWMANVVAARSFELTLTDAANPAGYLQASRLFLGRYFEPLFNFNYGVAMSWEEASTQERTEGGTLRTDSVDPYRRWSLSMEDLSEGERAQLTEICRRVGMREDLFLSCYPGIGGATESDHAGQAKLVQAPKFTRRSSKIYATDLIFEEA